MVEQLALKTPVKKGKNIDIMLLFHNSFFCVTVIHLLQSICATFLSSLIIVNKGNEDLEYNFI